MTDYQSFLATKTRTVPDAGISIDTDDLHPSLFAFQRDLVAWAAKKGRAAIWADTGLGKTRMQLEWARVLGQPVLIIAPLAVTAQTNGWATRRSHGGRDLCPAHRIEAAA